MTKTEEKKRADVAKHFVGLCEAAAAAGVLPDFLRCVGENPDYHARLGKGALDREMKAALIRGGAAPERSYVELRYVLTKGGEPFPGSPGQRLEIRLGNNAELMVDRDGDPVKTWLSRADRLSLTSRPWFEVKDIKPEDDNPILPEDK